MNEVIFGKGLRKPRQMTLSGLTAGAFAVVVAGILGAIGFGGGYWYSSITGSGVSASEMNTLSEELRYQRDNIETIRQGNEDTLDAMAIRIAPEILLYLYPAGVWRNPAEV